MHMLRARNTKFLSLKTDLIILENAHMGAEFTHNVQYYTESLEPQPLF